MTYIVIAVKSMETIRVYCIFFFYLPFFSRIIQKELIVRSARCLTTDREIKLLNTKMLANVCLLIPAIIIIIFFVSATCGVGNKRWYVVQY